uniref:EF-hand domain-containing protein n=1 Tax=Seriola lalandi dorsalis TaxID=1841481 RepID=A0A3B4WK70_SERLL
MDGDGSICDYELHELLKEAGHPLPGYMVREIIQKLDRNKDNKISFDEFLSVGQVELRAALIHRLPFCYSSTA